MSPSIRTLVHTTNVYQTKHTPTTPYYLLYVVIRMAETVRLLASGPVCRPSRSKKHRGLWGLLGTMYGLYCRCVCSLLQVFEQQTGQPLVGF